ncbi:MAG: NADH:ubiquinone reductase (Na(+)-transporting) subunit F, partial [Pararheinheimera sp.]|nr:NADH:ubiquinone reductase (Na(+)-transporting) subunit F [Rheinheimera sp.]
MQEYLDIYLGVGMFTLLVVALVVMILAAKAKLVSSGEITININGDASKAIKTSAGGKLLSVLAD